MKEPWVTADLSAHGVFGHQSIEDLIDCTRGFKVGARTVEVRESGTEHELDNSKAHYQRHKTAHLMMSEPLALPIEIIEIRKYQCDFKVIVKLIRKAIIQPSLKQVKNIVLI